MPLPHQECSPFTRSYAVCAASRTFLGSLSCSRTLGHVIVSLDHWTAALPSEPQIQLDASGLVFGSEDVSSLV